MFDYVYPKAQAKWVSRKRQYNERDLKIGVGRSTRGHSRGDVGQKWSIRVGKIEKVGDVEGARIVARRKIGGQ